MKLDIVIVFFLILLEIRSLHSNGNNTQIFLAPRLFNTVAYACYTLIADYHYCLILILCSQPILFVRFLNYSNNLNGINNNPASAHFVKEVNLAIMYFLSKTSMIE